MGKAGAGTMTMTYERFEYLTDAYGGDLRRWPEAEREAARQFGIDPRAAVLLREADGLDALLDVAPQPAQSHVLREQVIASAGGAAWGASARSWASRPGCRVGLGGGGLRRGGVRG